MSALAALRAALPVLIFASSLSALPAKADAPTPNVVVTTPNAVPSTATPTPPVPTATAVLLNPTATAPITITREHSTPIVTVGATSVAAVSPTATSTLVSETQKNHATSTTPTPSPVPGSSGTPVSISWPTPSQLRESAQLRWGKGVPSSVHRWAFLIVPAARKYGVDPNLVAAVMTMESNGDPLALSPADARGLMQILHGPWDPTININTGVRMLSQLYDEFGSWSLALAAYNAGPQAVRDYGGIPPYRETTDYVIIVNYLWDLYGHKQITKQRRVQYERTLADLRRFNAQRKKVVKLAAIAHLRLSLATECLSGSCAQLFGTQSELDPFWLDTNVPDPLQKVSPPPASTTKG